MKKKKSKKPKTKLTQKPENADEEFDDIVKALLEVPKKSIGKKEEPTKNSKLKDVNK